MSTDAADIDAGVGEVAALALKAARGAGLPWGTAEEAADAVRVLLAEGVPGAALLCAVLEADPAGGSPLTVGMALSDRAATLCAKGPEALPPVVAPALILPFVLRAARAQGRAFHVTGGGMDAICLPEGRLGGALPRGAAPAVPTVTAAAPPLPVPPPLRTRAHIPADVWARLQGWAAQTCAPATETSRRRGAGAQDEAE